VTDELTDKQNAVLDVIEWHWRAQGVAPSVADIATRLGSGCRSRPPTST
jgi:SOS-response transcriptional repressor LexA